MAPQINSGVYVGKQPTTPSDPGETQYETFWVWKPDSSNEFWILYRGPASDVPFAEPSAQESDVWLRITYSASADYFSSVMGFQTWVLARLDSQGRAHAPSDIETLHHTL